MCQRVVGCVGVKYLWCRRAAVCVGVEHWSVLELVRCVRRRLVGCV